MTIFGINFQLEKYSVDLALNTAQLLEDLGFNAIFVNDHYMKPNDSNSPDAYLTLSAIAAQTKKILIGTAVTPIPFRPAPLIAKMVATLDNISKGRFLFGVGAGRIETEFEAYGVEFLLSADRVTQTVESLKLIKRMWTEKKVTFKGVYNKVKDSVLLPKPFQKPHPPILIGSRGPRMCKVTARLADGWIPIFLTQEEYKQQMEKILREANKLGRRRDDFTFVHNIPYIPAMNRKEGIKKYSENQFFRARNESFAIGSPRECAQQLQGYIDLGIDLILIRLYNVHKFREQILTIHHKILPRLSS